MDKPPILTGDERSKLTVGESILSEKILRLSASTEVAERRPFVLTTIDVAKLGMEMEMELTPSHIKSIETSMTFLRDNSDMNLDKIERGVQSCLKHYIGISESAIQAAYIFLERFVGTDQSTHFKRVEGNTHFNQFCEDLQRSNPHFDEAGLRKSIAEIRTEFNHSQKDEGIDLLQLTRLVESALTKSLAENKAKPAAPPISKRVHAVRSQLKVATA